MDHQKNIETDKKNGYVISVSEEYFQHTYPKWETMSGFERMDIRNSFISGIEAFMMGTANKGISGMSFVDQHLKLKQAITIAPICDNGYLN